MGCGVSAYASRADKYRVDAEDRVVSGHKREHNPIASAQGGKPASNGGGGAANCAPQAKGNPAKPKLDPRDFTFSNLSGEVRVKLPGSIKGQQFIIDACVGCDLYVLDHCGMVTIDDCRDCRIFVGPTDGSIFLRNCSGCKCVLLCRQLRTRDCKSCELQLLCRSRPIIETSNAMGFGCCTFEYAGLQQQLAAAQLSPFHNFWWDVYDYTPPEDCGGPVPPCQASNWYRLMPGTSAEALLGIVPPEVQALRRGVGAGAGGGAQARASEAGSAGTTGEGAREAAGAAAAPPAGAPAAGAVAATSADARISAADAGEAAAPGKAEPDAAGWAPVLVYTTGAWEDGRWGCISPDGVSGVSGGSSTGRMSFLLFPPSAQGAVQGFIAAHALQAPAPTYHRMDDRWGSDDAEGGSDANPGGGAAAVVAPGSAHKPAAACGARLPLLAAAAAPTAAGAAAVAGGMADAEAMDTVACAVSGSSGRQVELLHTNQAALTAQLMQRMAAAAGWSSADTSGFAAAPGKRLGAGKQQQQQQQQQQQCIGLEVRVRCGEVAAGVAEAALWASARELGALCTSVGVVARMFRTLGLQG